MSINIHILILIDVRQFHRTDVNTKIYDVNTELYDVNTKVIDV